mmetsp:Transcript_18871/g.52705  ORF Transcript_18871/g.52705 Transcript_18871/m.52705 type:complete len:241 (-) Transcript_18871:239-961(-)|eukprot:CAMPEP_0172369308 /NCGR_PEP_ID=MMETSP1060-20121228/32013_1 /TAXON_ID=37318 /ORGANISM="Pseudo-nitzschia pungens, Strain cf. cingulata" /LENGTH=240 /DNA_ID=CAMNT_0013094185 /DNA_START=115 /DNA_END=837 /DNA_ORIENTATION=-
MEMRKKTSQETPDLSRVGLRGDGNEQNGDYKKDQRAASLSSRALDWVESRKVPSFVSRFVELDVPGDDALLITGLRKVMYGTQPAAEVVKIAGFSPPRYLCYMISGSGCDVIQFFLYIFFYWQLKNASLCWALSFGSSIVFRHTTHRYLVFGDYVGGYWRSLGRMYAGYSIIIVLSTIFNFIVTKTSNIPHVVTWILTMLWTGIVNYFILKKLWSFDGKTKEDDTKFRGAPTDDIDDTNI